MNGERTVPVPSPSNVSTEGEGEKNRPKVPQGSILSPLFSLTDNKLITKTRGVYYKTRVA